MASKTISVDAEVVESNVKKITTHIEDFASVSSSVLSHHTGASVGVAANFHRGLATTAADLPKFVGEVTAKLKSSQEAITLAIADLNAQESSAADAFSEMFGTLASDVAVAIATAGDAGGVPQPGSTPAPVAQPAANASTASESDAFH
jgi:hypothetical protein